MLAEIMAAQGRELLGAAAPSDVDRKLIGLTIVSGGLDLTDFFTAFILASIHMPAAHQAAGSA